MIANFLLRKIKVNKNKINNLHVIKFLFKYIKSFRIFFFILLTIALISSIVNVLLIIGLGDLQLLIQKIILNNFNKNINANKDLIIFVNFSIILIFGYLIFSIFRYFHSFISNIFINKIGFKLRIDLFNKIQMLPISYFDKEKNGNMMSILTNDTSEIISFLINNSSEFMLSFFGLIPMLIIMFLISSYISLAILIIVLIFILIIYFLVKKTNPAFLAQQKALGKLNGFIEESISGFEIIKLFSQQENNLQEFKKYNNDLLKKTLKAQSFSSLIVPLFIFLSNFIVPIQIILSYIFLSKNINFGSTIQNLSLVSNNIFLDHSEKIYIKISILTSFVLASKNFIQPLNRLIDLMIQLQSMIASTNRVCEIFHKENENKKSENLFLTSKLKGEILFDKVFFSYTDNKDVLKDISFKINAKQTVAIIGPTGSGKSTIANLITKFYDLENGDIFIDNYNIKNIDKESLRKQISIILQNNFLFSYSIIDNLKMVNEKLTYSDILTATKATYCDEFIKKLPNGYDTKLSENVDELSTGQKQLLCIARAMLVDSSILILDEATSNIDINTEKKLQSAIKKLTKNKTTIIIAHRLSTIKSADKIIVLNDGKIIEIGNHKQLIKSKGFYYNLVMSKSNILSFGEK